MYVAEHALLNLIKNKGRNILHGFILIAVITSAVVGLSIYNATHAVIEESTLQFSTAVSIRPQMRRVGGEGDSPTSVVTVDEVSFRQMINPIKNLQDVAFTFLFIVLIFGTVILILLSVMSIRERKYEIGVLRAMGMKKKKIALCLWIEMMVIAFVCFVFGIIFGACIVTPVANIIWTGETSINIAPDVFTIMQILGFVLILTTITGVFSVSFITKYEPIKILMERN